jgi:hypothetical protein
MAIPKITSTCERCSAAFQHKSYVPRRFCSHRCADAANKTPLAERFARFVDKDSSPHGCWLWTGATYKRGYGQIMYQQRGHAIQAHRVSWEMTHGTIPNGLHVLHNCPGGDNPRCVNPAHLFLGTHADNVADMVRKGRSARGERQPNAKLTEQSVKEIRAAVGMHRDVASKFNVSESLVRGVRSGKRWRHVS